MVLSLGFLLLGSQVTIPELMPGSTAAFYRACEAVAKQLESGQFASANRLLSTLPDAMLTISWDDSEAPSHLRNLYQQARDQAVAAWKSAVPSLNVTYGKRGRLHISFASQLSPNQDSPGPAGAVVFTSSHPSDVPVEMIIACVRGSAKVPAEPRDVRNEVMFAIGTALGLERAPFTGSAMGRHELPYAIDLVVSDLEREHAEHNLRIAAALRTAVSKKQKITLAKPQLRINPLHLKGPSNVVQGQVVPMTLELTNVGTGTLHIKLVPDCGCFILGKPAPIASGETQVVQVQIQTRDFPGELAKTLFVYSNDVEQPIRLVPMTMTVEPRFSFLTDSAANTIVVDDSGGRIDLYLDVNARYPFEATEVTVQGQKAAASLQPYTGDFHGRSVNGYKIGLLLSPNTIPGRSMLSLTVKTTDPEFGDLRYAFYVQKGIVVLPENVYLGRVRKQEASSYLFVQRPGRPFQVLAVEIDHPNISASFVATEEPGQYRVSIRYDGKAIPGHFDATVRIRTDDPQQPVLTATVSGIAE